MMEDKIGLYVHIPFCAKKCEYCDFLSFPCMENRFRSYTDALVREIREKGKTLRDASVDTVFIGGGTPSLLPAEMTKEIAAAIRESFFLEKDAEFTVECNPGSAAYGKLCGFREAGINRLSIGVQSLDDGCLKLLGRIHSGAQAEETFRNARRAGFDNVNLDLIFGLPGDDRKAFRETLDRASAMGPEHLSVYSLIVEEGTPLEDKIRRGLLPEPEEEFDREDNAYAEETLKAAGYRQYEISNYAKPGRESRHNMRYWQQREYLGLGLGSSSFLNGVRFSNTEDPEEYLKTAGSGTALREEIALTPGELRDEFLMLGFRMTEGPDFSEYFRKYGEWPEQRYGDLLDKLENKGLLRKSGNPARPYALTREGLDLANLIFMEFVDTGR